MGFEIDILLGLHGSGPRRDNSQLLTEHPQLPIYRIHVLVVALSFPPGATAVEADRTVSFHFPPFLSDSKEVDVDSILG